MRVRSTILGSLMIFSLLISTAAFAEPVPAAGAPTNSAAAADPLLQLLVAKGVLNGDEASLWLALLRNRERSCSPFCGRRES